MKCSGWIRPIALAAVLASCQAKVVPTTVKGSPKPLIAQGSPAPSATPAKSAAPTPQGTPGGALLKPSYDVRTLAGTVQLEAAYVVGQNAGQLLSNNGGSVLELSGAGGLIANNGGNIISNNAGTLISDHGGGLISDHGGGLISDHGGGLIAPNGAGLIAPNGAAYRLAAAAAPQSGTILPAAGMAFRAVDLATGLPLPLGVDAAGRPAYEIVTNATGAFEIYLPAKAAGTVRFVAAPVTAKDERLLTDDMESAATAAVTLDEDSAQVVSYVRYTATQGVLANVGRVPADVLTDPIIPLLSPGEKDAVITGWQALITGMIAAKLDRRPKAEQLVISERIADLAIARVALDKLLIKGNLLDNVGLGSFLPATDEPAIAAIADVMKRIRGKITTVFRREADPVGYFAAQDYMVAANAKAPTPYRILKPADFNDFIIRGYVANPDLDTAARYSALISLLGGSDVHLKAPDAVRLLSGEKAIFDAIDAALYLNGAKGLADALSYLKRLPPAP